MSFDLLIIGIVAYGIASFMDHAMDYGQALGQIRYRLAYLLANGAEKRAMKSAATLTKFHDRMQKMDDLYHMVATHKPYLILILCRKCMAFWVCLGFAIAFSAGGAGFFVILGTAFALSIFDK